MQVLACGPAGPLTREAGPPGPWEGAGMTMLGRHLLETGQLRDGIGLDEVRDVLWTYLAIDTYERLVLTQGWPPERYSRWLAHAITSALCP
jgi:hypothetical protein